MTTKEEKKAFIFGEAHGLSIAVVAMIIGAVVFTVTIGGRSDANANRLSANEMRHDQLRTAYIQHSRIMDDNVANMRADIGEIKGMLKVLISNDKPQK